MSDINKGVKEVLDLGFKVAITATDRVLTDDQKLTERDLKMLRYGYFAGAKDGIKIGNILSNSEET